VLGAIGVRVLLPLEYVRGPVDDEPPPLGRLPLNEPPPPGRMIGPPEECDVRGCVMPLEFDVVLVRGEVVAACGGVSSGLPHWRQTLPPSATSLIALQFLQVTKKGAGAVGAGVDGVGLEPE
jgi:hypothetical protein